MAIALDRLSTLPDSLLCLILSKLPFRRVVQCSVLSKRWRFIYREMPNLDLCPIVLTPQYAQHPTPDPLFIATFEHIISNILQSHSSDLADVCLTNYTDDSMDIRWRFTRQSVSNWLECLSRKNVKKLIFSESPERESPAPEALFSCTALTYLTLNNYILTRIPTQFAGFKHLLKCTFTSIELTDDSLAIFISQCPLLLNLRLLECVGLREPVISALKVTDLALNVHGLQVLTVKCPKLKNFANLGYFASFPEVHENWGRIKDLRANGVSFRELSPAVKSFEMHLGNNLISLLLDLSTRDGGYNCPADRFFQIVGSLKSLKVLDIAFSSLGGSREVAVPILSLLGRLPNLEHFGLKGRPILEEELQRNPMPSYLSSPVANLRSLEININTCDETVLGLWSCLLQRSPNLKSFKFSFPMDIWFNEKWVNLKRVHEKEIYPKRYANIFFISNHSFQTVR